MVRTEAVQDAIRFVVRFWTNQQWETGETRCGMARRKGRVSSRVCDVTRCS